MGFALHYGSGTVPRKADPQLVLLTKRLLALQAGPKACPRNNPTSADTRRMIRKKIVRALQDDCSAVVAIPAPTAYWKFDEVSGSRFDSVSGLELPVGGGDPPSPAGKFGRSIQFVVNSGAILDTGNSGATPIALNCSNGCFTIACWVKLNSGNNFTLPLITFNGGLVGYLEAGYAFELPTQGVTGVISATSFYAHWGTLSHPRALAQISSPPLSIGDWHLFAYWLDPADSLIRLQIDNGPVAVGSLSEVVPSGACGIYSADGDDYVVASNSDYQVDEFGVWFDRVLTADERTSLYNLGTGKTYPFS